MPVTIRDIDWSTANVCWNTPSWIIDLIKEVFHGTIDLDPCSNRTSKVKARVNYIYPKKDGPRDTWQGFQRIYCNPPYGKGIDQWMRRCVNAYIRGSQVIALVPSYYEVQWWQRIIMRSCQVICVPQSRIQFSNATTSAYNSSPPMGTSLVYWGEKFNHFINIMKPLGQILIPLPALQRLHLQMPSNKAPNGAIPKRVIP
jgi:hypothetical protein